jgi:uncharacterized C2H2 Zn-finger protein
MSITRQRYLCKEANCQKTYSSRDKLNFHIKIVHKGITESVICRYCSKTFSRVGHRKQHENAQHMGVAAYDCTRCEKTFKTKFSLNGHVRKNHGQRFICEKCGKSYIWKQNLIEHMQSCDNSRKTSFSCEVCKAEYSLKRNLFRHIKSQHSSPENNIKICAACGKEYKHQSSLLRHVKKSH